MKFKDIVPTEEEVVQSLKEAGLEVFTPEDADFDTHLTIKELADLWCENRLRALDDLYNIAVEPDARERTSNCVIKSLLPLSWDEVRNKGIEALMELKKD